MIEMLPAAQALSVQSLATPPEHGIASRVLAKAAGGNLTLFAFAAGQGLTTHSSPFEAFVLVLDGIVTLTVDGTPIRATPGTVVRMPANVPHAVHTEETARLILFMLRD